MKFHVRSSGAFYSKEESKKLEELGFEFEPYKSGKHVTQHKIAQPTEPIEISSLDELQSFGEKWGQLVLSWPEESVELPDLEIYDDYRE